MRRGRTDHECSDRVAGGEAHAGKALQVTSAAAHVAGGEAHAGKALQVTSAAAHVSGHEALW